LVHTSYSDDANTLVADYKDLPLRKEGYVYVIRDVEISGYYKIGYTKRTPSERLAEFHDELPIRIEPVLILRADADAEVEEKELHRHYKARRIQGEWFDLSGTDLSEIRNNPRLVYESGLAPFTKPQASNCSFNEHGRVLEKHYENYPVLEHPKGYIYIIKDLRFTRLYKVVTTRRPKFKDRKDKNGINDFGVDLPFKTIVIHILPCDDVVKAAHDFDDYFAGRFKSDKWLDLSLADVDEICRALSPRDGTDLHQKIDITLLEAYIGVRRFVYSYDREISVSIPRGAVTGMKIPVIGAGEPGKNGGKNGDLFVEVSVAAHQRFERKGDDLYVNIDVDQFTAKWVGEADVPTMTGTERLKIRVSTHSDQRLRLPGKGMPKLNEPGAFGDLYAQVELPHYEAPRQQTWQSAAYLPQQNKPQRSYSAPQQQAQTPIAPAKAPRIWEGGGLFVAAALLFLLGILVLAFVTMKDNDTINDFLSSLQAILADPGGIAIVPATITEQPTLTATLNPTEQPTLTETSIPTERPTSTPLPTLTATPIPTERPTSTSLPTLTATPIPTELPTATEVTVVTLYVKTDGSRANVRPCPGTACTVIGKLEPGVSIQVLGEEEGEIVYGSSKWIRFMYDGEVAFVHSELTSYKE